MACAVYTVRNYKISNAPLAANAALRMACAVEDGRNYKISNAPLAANAAREEGLHERSSYLISPDDLPPSKGEGALPENGMRHIDNKKTPVDCEQAPDDYHYKISNAPLAANAARGMACAIYKTKKYLLIVSKLSSGDIFLSCAWLIL